MAGLFESMGYPQAGGLFGGLYDAFSSVANPEMAMKLRYMQEEEKRKEQLEQAALSQYGNPFGLGNPMQQPPAMPQAAEQQPQVGVQQPMGMPQPQQMAQAQPQQGGMSQRLSDMAKFLSDPRIRPERKKPYEAVFANELKRQMGVEDFSKNPVYGTDADGNPIILQLSDRGRAQRTAIPDGIRIGKGAIEINAGTETILLDPITRQPIGKYSKNNAEANKQKELGTIQGRTEGNLPTSILVAEQTTHAIDELIKHPGLDSIVGQFDQYRPTWTLSNAGNDALARYKQLKGKAFLQAYQTLRGGGQITEKEGDKAESAMVRMDRALGENEFRAALSDFRDAVRDGVAKLKQQAGGGSSGGFRVLGVR
jgi:hypothetical protein